MKKEEIYFNEKLIKPLFVCIREILDEGKHADKCLQKFFEKIRNIKREDKAFASTLLYDLIRNWRLLKESCNMDNEMIFKNPFAFLPAYYLFKKKELPKSLEGIHFPEKFFLRQLEKNLAIRKVRESYPDELDEYAENQLGKTDWDQLATELNKNPKQYIRTNTFKIKRSELIDLLKDQHFKCTAIESSNAAIEVSSYKSLFETNEFHEGLFEVQDLGSQKVSELINPKQGSFIIDTCAGTGGKTLHLAALLKNTGKIIAMDIYEHKLNILKQRAKRAGFTNIETRLISPKIIQEFKHKADIILMDVPCSGTGVFKRNPDAKWHINAANIQELIHTQSNILSEYSGLCKKGGKVFYVNCSIFPSEGEKQINEFTTKFPQWKQVSENRIDPRTNNSDGFYITELTSN